MFTPWRSAWLDSDEKYQIFLEDEFKDARPPGGQKDLNADITIFVAFSPWYAWWTSAKEFRFVTKKLSDGKTYWIPMPLNK
jgi:hypothetical protein